MHDPHADHVGWLPEEPVTPDCPLECLRYQLSGRTYRALDHGLPTLLGHPAAVRDVADLHRQRRLNGIPSLGPRRVGEIELMLVTYGFCIAPADSRSP